jgi:hypothetical protein
MIPLWKGKNSIYFGVKSQGHRYYDIENWSYRAETTLLSKILFIVMVTLTFDRMTLK